MSLHYSENFAQATHIGREAFSLAEDLNIPENPVTYAVLYEYFSGRNPGLSKAVDLLRGKAEYLTAERIQVLYETYISPSEQQVMKDLRQVVGDLFKSTQDSLAQVHEGTKRYQNGLDNGARLLGEATDQHEWLMIARRLIRETREMQTNAQQLNQELSQAYNELDELRQECQQVRRESMRDPLTGIKNRRAFDLEIKEYCAQGHSNNKPLSLLMVDIDHFKNINDTFGHVTGDAVLKWVASMIGETVRGGDILARYGGEEFAVLLPDTMLDGADHVATNICRRVSSQKLKNSDQRQSIGRVTVSLGLARYRPGETVEQFIGRADEALYLAKSSGRNRVCRYTVKMEVAS